MDRVTNGDSLKSQQNWNWNQFQPNPSKKVIVKNKDTKKGASNSSIKPSSQLGTQKVEDETVETYSGLSIKESDMKSHMEGRQMIPIASLVTTPQKKLEDQSLDWVVIGVLSQKTLTRTSTGGGKYMMMTLSDLKNTCISLFLFGDAYEAHWREDEGSLLAVINPGLVPSNENGKFALKVKLRSELAKIGMATDFGLCKANTKAGSRCKNPVNKSKCDYCSYHVASQFKKAGGRMQLNSSTNTFLNSQVKRISGAQVHVSKGTYQPFHLESGLAAKLKNPSSSSLANTTATAASSFLSSTTKISSSGQLSQDFKKTNSSVRQDKETLERIKENLLLSQTNKKMTRGMATIATYLGVKSKSSSVGKVNMMEFMNSSKSKKEDQSRAKDQSSVVTEGGVVIPKESKVFSRPSINIPLPNKTTHFSSIEPVEVVLDNAKLKQKEIAENLKKRGIPLNMEDSHIMKLRKVPSAFVSKQVQVGGNLSKQQGNNLSQVFLKTFGKTETLDENKVKELENKKSSHVEAANEIAFQQLEKTFSSLEEKEKMAERMSEIMEIQVSAYQCHECKYTNEIAAKYCRDQGHRLTKLQASKRWFLCGHCNHKVTTIGLKKPQQNCRNCSRDLWIATSMYRMPKEKKNEFNKSTFQPCGEKQINSLRFS